MNQSNRVLPEHHLPVRVYYEDTDAAGVVYYPNYLRFCERARTEWLRTFGFNQSVLKKEHDLVFVVSKVQADYLKSAELDDELTVVSKIDRVGGASISFGQTVTRAGLPIFVAHVTIACVNWSTRQAARLPQSLKTLLDPSE